MEELLRLRRFLDRPPSPTPQAAERCELCGAALAPEHSHVVDLESRRLMCSCRPCRLLFMNPGAAGGRYRAVGERYERLAESEVDWEPFDMPAGMAFFIRSSKANRVSAFYPSPGGATESALPVDASWPALSHTRSRYRGAAGIPAGRGGRMLDRAGGCLLRTGGADPAVVEGIRRRSGGARGNRKFLREAARAEERGMPDLIFSITGARAERHAAAPALSFRLRIQDAAGVPIHAVLLRIQIQIQPRRRRYSARRAGAAGGFVRRAGPLERDGAFAALDACLAGRACV